MIGNTEALLKLDGATVEKNGVRILDSLSLQIPQGEHTAILGANGSGKSTLIKLITRRLYPLARPDGRPAVTLFGRDRWDVSTLRSLLGIVSADLHQAFLGGDSDPGLDVVLSGFFSSQGLAAHHSVTSAMRVQAQAALTLMDAAHLAAKPMQEMSTGEARRILIARALAPDPRALLLDEPTTGLDLPAKHHFLNTLRQVAQNGKTLVLITHHIDEILPEIERVILLRAGRVFLDGPKATVLTTTNLSALFDAGINVRESAGYYAAEMKV